MITIPAPSGFVGDELVEDLEAAGYEVEERASVVLNGENLVISVKTASGKEVDEDDNASVQKIKRIVSDHAAKTPAQHKEWKDRKKRQRVSEEDASLVDLLDKEAWDDADRDTVLRELLRRSLRL